jgi:hypothetical protein
LYLRIKKSRRELLLVFEVFKDFQMLKIVFKVLQRLKETVEAGVRKLRNAQKLKIGMRKVAQIIIPMGVLVSPSNYRHITLKVIIDWYVSFTFFPAIFVPNCVRGFHFSIGTECIEITNKSPNVSLVNSPIE